jgi:hypothetical protein
MKRKLIAGNELPIAVYLEKSLWVLGFATSIVEDVCNPIKTSRGVGYWLRAP